MPDHSLVADHPQISAMIALRREGRPVSQIAEMFQVSPTSLRRYLRKVAPTAAPVYATVDLEDDTPEIFDDPVDTFRAAFGLDPYPWQPGYLRETRDLVFLKGRQIGATEGAAGLAIHVARSGPGPDVVVVSPTLRQSQEVSLRARRGLWALGERLPQDSASVVRLANGSRIVSLAGTPRSARGYSARLLIVDEAAYVDDDVWDAVRPIVAATGGRTVVQSTPALMEGFFWELNDDTPDGWAKLVVPSSEVLPAERLEAERERLRKKKGTYEREYLASFQEVQNAGILWTKSEWDELIVPADQTRKVS